MSGKGELVEYTREFRKGEPVSDAEKKKLKEKMVALIDQAAKDITVEITVKK